MLAFGSPVANQLKVLSDGERPSAWGYPVRERGMARAYMLPGSATESRVWNVGL